jgi:hypothetical protein
MNFKCGKIFHLPQYSSLSRTRSILHDIGSPSVIARRSDRCVKLIKVTSYPFLE